MVAVPQFSTPKNVPTSGDDTGVIARQVADVIASDLRSSGQLVALGADHTRVYSYSETTAPLFRLWRNTGAKVLVTGFVEARPDGRVTVGCYLHDIASGQEMTRQGFAITPTEWRRAAHRCSDAVYSKLTGRSGGFESLVAYVAESGAGANRVKRIAVMDSDGSSHRYVTAGDTMVVTPRLSPDRGRVAYVGFSGGRPQARIADLSSNDDRPLTQSTDMSFAPGFSPDGTRVAFSMASGGNTDLYVTDLGSGGASRLTNTPGIDTSPSYSPDGNQIVFESDRSGSPQLYVMNADGSSPRRISFGGGRYGSPVVEPGRGAYRLHPDGRRRPSDRRDEPERIGRKDRHLGTGGRGAELGRERAQPDVPAHRRRQDCALHGDDRQRRGPRHRHAAGRVGSRLVGGSSEMIGLRLLCALLMATGGTLAAALPAPPPLPPPITIDGLRLAFTAQSGSNKVYFAGDSHGLDLSAQRTLAAQARWLRANPMISVRIEGHSDERATRDHALAVGERRANAVREFLVLQGVPAGADLDHQLGQGAARGRRRERKPRRDDVDAVRRF